MTLPSWVDWVRRPPALPIAHCLLPLLLIAVLPPAFTSPSWIAAPISHSEGSPAPPPPSLSQDADASAHKKAGESASAFLVVIDPAHGGSETGARVTASLLEKDLTLLLARKLKQQLDSSHISTTLLRDADSQISVDRRAVLANQARPSVFISLHAEPGSVLRIFTSSLAQPQHGLLDSNGFLPWNSAQAAFTQHSSALAAEIVRSLNKRELSSQVRPAFLNPLPSIAAPAIAIEVPANAKGLAISPDLLAGAIAEAIAIQSLRPGAPR